VLLLCVENQIFKAGGEVNVTRSITLRSIFDVKKQYEKNHKICVSAETEEK